MTRRATRPTRKTPAPLLVQLFIALGGLLQVTAFLAVTLAVGLLSLVSSEQPKLHRPHHFDSSPWLGLAAACLWSLITGALVAVLAGSADVFWAGAALSLPLTAFVGWRVARIRTAFFYAALPTSLLLGYQRSSRFAIRQPYAINGQDRFKQLFIEGPMGSGKSTALINYALSDIRNGNGVCVIDVKDDLIDKILPHIPPYREKDVIVFDIEDREFPLGLNKFDSIPPDTRSLAASEVVAVLKRYFEGSGWGPRLEHILRNITMALLERPGSTVLDIPKVLLEPEYAEEVFAQVSNIGVQQFFVEFQQILQKNGAAIAPLLNKTGAWIAYPELRNIIGQTTSSFNIRQVMDQGLILLVRIPQGVAGEDVSSLLAALLVAMVQLAAHSRVDTPQEKRRPFYLYCDEFQNYDNSSFLKLLTESRAFRLGLIGATQFLKRLPDELQQAIIHNVATSIECMGEPGPFELRLTRLEMLRRNPDAEPMTLTPLSPPPPGDPAVAERIRALSRTRYGRSRAEVEADILRRYGSVQPSMKSQSGKRSALKVVGGVDIEEE